MKSTHSYRQHKQPSALSYPVSGKFLREIMQRIESAAAIVSLSPTAAEKLRQAILLYLDCRAVPTTDEAPEVILAFHLLKPEIDKAISRSEGARARAAKRREEKAEKTLPLRERRVSHLKKKTAMKKNSRLIHRNFRISLP